MKLFIFIFALSTSFSAFADYLEVSRAATLKVAPDRDAVIVRNAEKGEMLELMGEGSQYNGYYKVWLPIESKEVYIYRTLVRRKPGYLPTADADIQEVSGTACGKHLRFGIPADSDQILCRKGYALGYNYTYKVPDWVSYHAVAGSQLAGVERRNRFITDREIPAEYRSSNADYANSGYDRGHMAPSAIIRFSQEANDETFFFSNMTPQLPGFNRNMMGNAGVWGMIEDDVRDWLQKSRNELYIIAGTHFNSDYSTIGVHNVGVPNYLFKIIYDPVRSEAIAFWMPQDEDSANQIRDYVQSIDFIEGETGFDFLSNVNDSIEAVIESKVFEYDTWISN